MTIKQIQCLLQFLGFYDGGVDGIWGAKSIAATKSFQTERCISATGICNDDTQKAMVEAVGDWTEQVDTTPATGTFWDGIKYFTREEFRCKCGGRYCNGFPAEPAEKLIKVADRVREHFGKPMTVSSGVRCQTHNDAQKGSVPNSRHIQGKAMDFCISGVSAVTVLAYVNQQPEIRYAYAIDGSYVHMDIE